MRAKRYGTFVKVIKKNSENVQFGSVQKSVIFIDLECSNMRVSVYLKKSSSIQPRTSLQS